MILAQTKGFDLKFSIVSKVTRILKQTMKLSLMINYQMQLLLVIQSLAWQSNRKSRVSFGTVNWISVWIFDQNKLNTTIWLCTMCQINMDVVLGEWRTVSTSFSLQENRNWVVWFLRYKMIFMACFVRRKIWNYMKIILYCRNRK